MEIRSPSVTGVMQAMMIIPAVVFGIAELLDRALPAGAHRAERRVPAEVGQVVAEIEDSLQQVLSLRRPHGSRPSTKMVTIILTPWLILPTDIARR